MKTETLLPYTRVVTYDLGKENFDRVFASPGIADQALARSGSTCANVYRIERINGEWRTDWELTMA